jgi:hypothetical protein
MAKQRVIQYQIEWNIKKGEGEAFFVTLVDDESEESAIHRLTEIDDDSFEVVQHLVNSGDSLYFDPETSTLGTGLISLDGDEDDFDDLFEVEDDEEEEDDDEDESEDEGEEESESDSETKS